MLVDFAKSQIHLEVSVCACSIRRNRASLAGGKALDTSKSRRTKTGPARGTGRPGAGKKSVASKNSRAYGRPLGLLTE
ncbi:hypothetical protein EVAR_49710_1 [Eumeta japonica]|uniref:Uncharacterized protein n=1 Tax=Eumeta variegata TaxID=151549 RepID=A0A4C1Z455_EUMVA|nr:hypothetical protein EVAR_49710_1 [Eumeta japonica]